MYGQPLEVMQSAERKNGNVMSRLHNFKIIAQRQMCISKNHDEMIDLYVGIFKETMQK